MEMEGDWIRRNFFIAFYGLEEREKGYKYGKARRIYEKRKRRRKEQWIYEAYFGGLCYGICSGPMSYELQAGVGS